MTVTEQANAGGAGISRRAFLRASTTVGGGMLLAASFPQALFAPASQAAESAEYPVTVFARFARTGAVSIIAPNPEMGQGIKTSLPMIFAEELGVAWKDVTIEMADFADGKLLGGQTSGGSMSTFANWMPLRRAGAAGRAMFESAAAQAWGVAPSECKGAQGVVTHAPSSRTLSYGELAAAASAQVVPDLEKVQLKDESEFQIIGQSIRDPDKRKVVTGQQLFGIDVKVPGMRYAVFHKGPVFDAAVKSVNAEEIKGLPGVSHVLNLAGAERQMEGPPGHPFLVIDDGLHAGVAIVADTWWHAQKARRQLKVEWDEGPHAGDSTDKFNAEARRLAAEPAQDSVRQDGDAESALAAAAKVVHASYSYPFISHATLEPQNCVAHYRDGKVEIWAPTQNPGAGRAAVAKALGIAPESVLIHMYRCGGGFGRRLANDYMIEAAVISREIGAPVKVLWSREDDIQHDFFRPGGYHNLTGGLDEHGKLIAWRNHFVGFSRNQYWNIVAVPARDAFPAGYVPNYSLKTSRIAFNVPVAPLRAPGDNAYAFVFQGFLDELAHAAGHDPIDFQIQLLRSPMPGEGVPNPAARQPPFNPERMIAVMEQVRERSGWRQRHALPHGQGMGFGCYWSHLGYVAQVHHVSVSRRGEVTPMRVWAVVDIGRHIVNPINAENQVQGAILDAISAANGQRITFEGGRVVQSNFHDYLLLRNRKIPAIDVHFHRTDNATTGLGEPAYPSAIPAYCNAVFAASGRRVRSLPVNLAAPKVKSGETNV